MDAEFLANCECISVAQDVRQHVLLVRFRGCTVDLQVRTGLLGYKTLGCESGAKALIKVMRSELEELCQDFDGCVQRDLLESLCKKVKLYTADGASDEQLAGRLLTQASSVFPHCRIVQRDGCHAAMSVLERPWITSPDLKSVIDIFALGSSIVQKVHYSPHLQEIFRSFIDNKRACNLAIAKQRFASVSKPLQRSIRNLDALLSTVAWVLTHRKPSRRDDSYGKAVEFLQQVGEREILLASIMADLSDEGMRLARFFDSTDFDVAERAFQIRSFMTRLHLLVNEARHFLLRASLSILLSSFGWLARLLSNLLPCFAWLARLVLVLWLLFCCRAFGQHSRSRCMRRLDTPAIAWS